MLKNKNKGHFITLEGIEGSGKTTQIKKIKSFLAGFGLSCVTTREPGGKHRLSSLRDIFLFPPEDFSFSVDPLAETFMLMADRTQHTKQVIIPSLLNGMWVVSDRYSDAAVAYQGYGKGVELSLLRNLNREATENTVPDITFLLDLDVEEGLRRIRARANSPIDRIENESFEFHSRVRNGYLKQAEMEPERFLVLDADKEIESIFNVIRSTLQARLACSGCT